MEILTTIAPIFVVIAVGWIARRRGAIPETFLGPANRLVYYLAIPAMVFRAVAGASLADHLRGGVLTVTLVAVVMLFGLAWATAGRSSLADRSAGTFIQSAFHGNLGYIGLAVAYYFLGDDGFVQTSLLAGFLMILQNFLAVVALTARGGSAVGDLSGILLKIGGNPVIVSAFLGIAVSLVGWPIPVVIDRALGILGGMALPLALLIIGASISPDLIRRRMGAAAVSSLMKLVVLPGIGFGFYRLLGGSPAAFLPALILLASPTATIVYVMAREMDGDAELAVATISCSTLLSMGTFLVWLSIARG